MTFKAYYDKRRFGYIQEELNKRFKLSLKNKSLFKKTACFFGNKFNFFIDTSDGINEDLGINEYCGRIIKIVHLCKDKPFLYFKTNFSFKYSSDIIRIAECHGGKVVGCFIWTFRQGYYDYILPYTEELRLKSKNCIKEYDIGFMGNLETYKYPKPNITNPLISWKDNRHYGLGSPVDTGYYEFNTRKYLYEKMMANFKIFRGDGYSFEDYIKESFKWKLCFNAPGQGEFTARAFIHSALGQPVFFRKNTYDNPISWKDYWPEIDFNSDRWNKQLMDVITHYKEWGEKSLYYYRKYLTPQNIVNYIYNKLLEFEAQI